MESGDTASGLSYNTGAMPELSWAQDALLVAAIGVVAVLYSSVGHGGATGYLAVAALIGIAPAVARPGALWMNCIVAGIAFWRFARAGLFDWKVFWRFAVASIPCAWVGSRMYLEGRAYSTVAGIALFAAGCSLAASRSDQVEGPCKEVGLPLALTIGAALGFVAGMTGIGGGVFLTPLLVLLRWVPAKVAGGISALFILVNSVSALAAMGGRALIWQPLFIFAVGIGALGALFGTWLGVKRWRTTMFRRALAVVLWIAAVKLLFLAR